MNRLLKTILQKINFQLGRNPFIIKRHDWRKYIPKPYKAVVIISADFELAWAWRYSKSSSKPYQKALKKGQQERLNVPTILNLCDHYNIPLTWLTVGHLFLNKCERNGSLPHPDVARISNFENEWWRFSGEDWFEYDPCTDYKNAPEWYCPDLISKIIKSKVNHEIGCHTFSHIDCRDSVCSSEVFVSEIEACKRAASNFGIMLKSFVHPGHTIGKISELAKCGFTSFRTNYRNVLGYPIFHSEGIWEFEQTADFVFQPGWSIDYHIYRFKKIIDRAIESNTICYFWFHPSINPIFIEKILPEVLGYIDENREKIFVSTHTAYTEWLEERRTQ